MAATNIARGAGIVTFIMLTDDTGAFRPALSFLTKRTERFMDCIPRDWKDGYDNVTVSCTVENQDRTDYRLSIFSKLPAKHKNIICQPLIEEINLTNYFEFRQCGTRFIKDGKSYTLSTLDLCSQSRKANINY